MDGVYRGIATVCLRVRGKYVWKPVARFPSSNIGSFTNRNLPNISKSKHYLIRMYLQFVHDEVFGMPGQPGGNCKSVLIALLKAPNNGYVRMVFLTEYELCLMVWNSMETIIMNSIVPGALQCYDMLLYINNEMTIAYTLYFHKVSIYIHLKKYSVSFLKLCWGMLCL